MHSLIIEIVTLPFIHVVWTCHTMLLHSNRLVLLIVSQQYSSLHAHTCKFSSLLNVTANQLPNEIFLTLDVDFMVDALLAHV